MDFAAAAPSTLVTNMSNELELRDCLKLCFVPARVSSLLDAEGHFASFPHSPLHLDALDTMRMYVISAP